MLSVADAWLQHCRTCVIGTHSVYRWSGLAGTQDAYVQNGGWRLVVDVEDRSVIAVWRSRAAGQLADSCAASLPCTCAVPVEAVQSRGPKAHFHALQRRRGAVCDAGDLRRILRLEMRAMYAIEMQTSAWMS